MDSNVKMVREYMTFPVKDTFAKTIHGNTFNHPVKQMSMSIANYSPVQITAAPR